MATIVDIKRQRELRTLRDGTPNFYLSFGAINSGASQYVSVEDQWPKARKYQPLFSLVITNNSGEVVDLELNGQEYAKLPAGVIWASDNVPVWTFKITNNDSTNVLAGEITANLSTPPMTQSEFTRFRHLYN